MPPRNSAPTLGGANLMLEAGAYDQSPLEDRADVLVYTTEPLAAPLEVTGDIRAEIWFITDAPDTTSPCA